MFSINKNTMMKLLILIALISLSLNDLFSQEFTRYSISTLDNPAPGYIFLDPILIKDSLGFYDNSGKVAFAYEINKGSTFTNIKFFGDKFAMFMTPAQRWIVTDLNFKIIDSIGATPPYINNFHDFLILPNGNYMLFGNERSFKDMSKLVTGGMANAIIMGYVIQEFDKNKKVVFEWHSLDHFNVLDVTSDIDLTQPVIEVCHENSLFLDIDGNIIVSNRHLDEITKISRSTGDIIWRMGGSECKNNQFKFINDSIDNFVGFSHQHNVYRLENGNLIMFDNGNLKPPKPFSRAVEYKLDEKNKTLTKIWESRHSPDLFTLSKGNVQRLPNGNTLIGWGGSVNDKQSIVATEVDSSGKVVFEMNHPIQGSYRVERHVFNMTAVSKLGTVKGNLDFSDSTTTSNIKLNIETINGKSDICVEKHQYSGDSLTFKNTTVCSILPHRWVISHYKPLDIFGKILIDLTYLGNFQNKNDLKIYYRPTEGVGDFSLLDSSAYVDISNSVVGNFKGLGEFILGYSQISPPEIISPLDNVENISIGDSIRWKHTDTSRNYMIEVSLDQNMMNPFTSIEIKNDNKLKLEHLEYLTNYYWHIKSSNTNCSSQWSQIFHFKTNKLTNIGEYESTKTGLVIYPNPAYDFIEIDLPVLEQPLEANQIQIYSIEGIKMKINELGSISSLSSQYSQGKIKLNVSDFEPGFYFIKVGSLIKSFVKM